MRGGPQGGQAPPDSNGGGSEKGASEGRGKPDGYGQGLTGVPDGRGVDEMGMGVGVMVMEGIDIEER